MSIIELIGFIISMLALTFLFGKQVSEEKKRQADPEGYAKREAEKQKALERFMLGLEPEEKPIPVKKVVKEIEEWEEHPLPPPLPEEKKIAPLHTQEITTPIQEIVHGLKSERSLPILHAIFGPPKGLQYEFETHRSDQ